MAQYLSEERRDYILWEKEDIFSGASSKNQNRLHLGFHYPRSASTRSQAKLGFDIFVETFKDQVFNISGNYYAVHSDSILDYSTFKTIFRAEGYIFDEVPFDMLPVKDIEGLIEVKELGICPEKSLAYWRERKLNIIPKSDMILDAGVLLKSGKAVSKHHDKIIDCTWGALQEHSASHVAENFMVLRVKKNRNLKFGALTVMDGPYFSIFPENSTTDDYTFTCVEHGKVPSGELSSSELEGIVSNNLDYVRSVYADFDKDFIFRDYYIGRKFKNKSRADSRALNSTIRKNVLTILSGKIDAVFHTPEIVDDFLSS